MGAPVKHVFNDEEKVAEKVCAFIDTVAKKALATNSVFTVGLSGGSLQKYICKHLPSINTNWSQWRIYFCDERVVPFDNDDSTYKYYRDNLMSKVPIGDNQIFPINPAMTVDDCAKDYTAKLRKVFTDVSKLPRFDLLLLGMGPDGHTCSLFPGHKLLQETELLVAPVTDSPKPPPNRITLTFPVINNAKCVAFTTCGQSKADVVKRILEGNETDPLPSARVSPHCGELHWFLDRAAASKLSQL